jgi:hypothetical protein
MTPPPVSNVKSLSMSMWAWAWGRRQTCRGLMTEMPSTALEIPSVVWSGTLHSALCTATLHHHLRYEQRVWVQPDVQPCPLRTTRNSSTAVRTCTACGGFDAAKDSDRSTAIQAKLYTVQYRICSHLMVPAGWLYRGSAITAARSTPVPLLCGKVPCQR